MDPSAPVENMKVDAFHRVILDFSSGSTDIAAVLARQFGHAADMPLRGRDWDRLETGFAASVSSDVDPAHCARLARRLFATLQRTPCPATMGELAARTELLYREIGLAFSDLLIDFVQAALATARHQGVTQTFFLARDAIPFYLIALELHRRSGGPQQVALLDFNRRMIPSFAAPDIPSCVPVEHYLGPKLAAGGRVALVDTGLYGSLIQSTLRMGLVSDPVVMFFASRNPSIFGYLNGLMSVKRTPGSALDIFGEACCDSLETWPKPYAPCALRSGADGVEAVSRWTDPVSVIASLALYRTLAQRARVVELNALDPRGVATRLDRQRLDPASLLMLPVPLPRWEHADAWQASWQSGPMAPLG